MGRSRRTTEVDDHRARRSRAAHEVDRLDDPVVLGTSCASAAEVSGAETENSVELVGSEHALGEQTASEPPVPLLPPPPPPDPPVPLSPPPPPSPGTVEGAGQAAAAPTGELPKGHLSLPARWMTPTPNRSPTAPATNVASAKPTRVRRRMDGEFPRCSGTTAPGASSFRGPASGSGSSSATVSRRPDTVAPFRHSRRDEPAGTVSLQQAASSMKASPGAVE